MVWFLRKLKQLGVHSDDDQDHEQKYETKACEGR